MILKNHLSPGSSRSNCTTVSLTLSCVAVARTSDSSFTAAFSGRTCLSSDFVGPVASNDVSKRVVGLNFPKVLKFYFVKIWLHRIKAKFESSQCQLATEPFRVSILCGGSYRANVFYIPAN